MPVTINGGGVPSAPMGKGGRPPGRALTAREERQLRFLISLRERASDAARDFDREIEDVVYELIQDGASSPSIAAVLNASPRTVSDWANKAKRRRQE
jgi:DNA-binding NarL/FixJ family response regulator